MCNIKERKEIKNDLQNQIVLIMFYNQAYLFSKVSYSTFDNCRNVSSHIGTIKIPTAKKIIYPLTLLQTENMKYVVFLKLFNVMVYMYINYINVFNAFICLIVAKKTSKVELVITVLRVILTFLIVNLVDVIYVVLQQKYAIKQVPQANINGADIQIIHIFHKARIFIGNW